MVIGGLTSNMISFLKVIAHFLEYISDIMKSLKFDVLPYVNTLYSIPFNLSILTEPGSLNVEFGL